MSDFLVPALGSTAVFIAQVIAAGLVSPKTSQEMIETTLSAAPEAPKVIAFEKDQIRTLRQEAGSSPASRAMGSMVASPSLASIPT